MAETVNMHDAKTQLSRLAERAAGGEEIIIARAGRPVAKLGPLEDEKKIRRLGLWEGQVRVADDFDDSLPEDVREAFEGESA